MSEENKILFYSLLSGDVYSVTEDELDNLDQFQIPIKAKPSGSCKKCHGRGYIGFDIHKKYYSMCKCTAKHIDRETITKMKVN